MEGLDGATDEQVAAFAEHVARLKHDLGKYIAFRQNWLADEADEDALRQALVADLHHTRRGPAGSVDAQTVWREFRPPLLGEVALAGLVVQRLGGVDEFDPGDGDIHEDAACSVRLGGHLEGLGVAVCDELQPRVQLPMAVRCLCVERRLLVRVRSRVG